MELEDLIRRARAAGVTMMIMDGGGASCWRANSRQYFRHRDPDPPTALRGALMKALDLEQPAAEDCLLLGEHDEEILI